MDENNFEALITFHSVQTPPKEEGCYLVVVRQTPEVTVPETELDSFILDLGGNYYSIAHWDGEEWDEIYYDNIIPSMQERDAFRVYLWADRDFI